MAELNQRERETVARLEELQRWQQTGERYVSDAMIAEAEQVATWAIRNAETRERVQQARQAGADVQAVATRARQDAQAQVAQDAFRQDAHRRFPRTDAEFAAAWPEILKQWQIRQALGEDDDAPRHAHQLYRHF